MLESWILGYVFGAMRPDRKGLYKFSEFASLYGQKRPKHDSEFVSPFKKRVIYCCRGCSGASLKKQKKSICRVSKG